MNKLIQRKYLLIDIIDFSSPFQASSFKLLHSTSRSTRAFLVRNYGLMKRMIKPRRDEKLYTILMMSNTGQESLSRSFFRFMSHIRSGRLIYEPVRVVI